MKQTSYKLPTPVTKYETVYTSPINFYIHLQSMKPCIRLLQTSISSYNKWNSVSVFCKLPHPVTKYEPVYMSFINFHIRFQSMKTVNISLINFHIQLQSMKQGIRLLQTSKSSYKVWNRVYVSYKRLPPVTKYETVYTSIINFHIRLQSMKQCIRLL